MISLGQKIGVGLLESEGSCKVDRPLLGGNHHDGGRLDSVLPHQEKDRALLREGEPGPCGGAGGHGFPAPAAHGASTRLLCLTT